MAARASIDPAEGGRYGEANLLADFLAALVRETLIRVARTYGLPVTVDSRRDETVAALLAEPAVEYGEDLLRRLRKAELARALERMPIAGPRRTREELIRTLLAREPLPTTGGKSRWRPFARARKFARSLKLLDQAEWTSYARGELERSKGLRPPDIPFSPRTAYRDQGWSGIRDWLGPSADLPTDPRFWPFRKARRFAWALGLGSAREWRDWCRGRTEGREPRPGEIPEKPDMVYPDAWRGWDDWLGTARTTRVNRSRFRPFGEAREFARGLGLRNFKEWDRYCRGELPGHAARPLDIPVRPHDAYRSSGFRGYDDWLDNEWPRRRPWIPLEEARAFARSLGLSKVQDWWTYTKGLRPDLPTRPPDLPVAADDVYRSEGWVSWGDFLGTGTVHPANRVFRPFAEAREFARSLGLRSSLEWNEWSKGDRPEKGTRPDDIPSTPYLAYRGQGWKGWGDFLGTGSISPGAREFRCFPEARAFARMLGLKSIEDWWAWRRGEFPDRPPAPDDIPADVRNYYRGRGWTNWPDFLGSGATPRRRRRKR